VAERYVVGVQLELRPGAVDADAMTALVAAMRPIEDVDWGGHPLGGRVEIMAELGALDARDAIAQGMAALRRAVTAGGDRFDGHRLRAVGAQPVDNPPDWLTPVVPPDA
jgi:hypothetical protein